MQFLYSLSFLEDMGTFYFCIWSYSMILDFTQNECTQTQAGRRDAQLCAKGQGRLVVAVKLSTSQLQHHFLISHQNTLSLGSPFSSVHLEVLGEMMKPRFPEAFEAEDHSSLVLGPRAHLSPDEVIAMQVSPDTCFHFSYHILVHTEMNLSVGTPPTNWL